jgi:hypothetical protein
MAAPHELVSLRVRREEIIARLSDAFARDELDVDEFERRVDLAHRADAVAALDALVADLSASDGAPASSTALARVSTDAPAHRRMLAIMGSAERRGRWTVPRSFRVVQVMGSVVLDFREAELAAGVTDLHLTCVLSSCELIVPPWLAVEMDGAAILSAFEHLERAPSNPDPAAPLLRVRGTCVMGSVEIETRLPGESRRDARRRAKRERRALKAQDRLLDRQKDS